MAKKIIYTCGNCGHETGLNDSFCGGCGSKLQQIDDAIKGFNVGDKVKLKKDALKMMAKEVPASSGYSSAMMKYRENLKKHQNKVGTITMVLSSEVNVEWDDGYLAGIKPKYLDKVSVNDSMQMNDSSPVAIFQEKEDGKPVGNKIYYYETKDPKWWFVHVGTSPYKGEIPEYGSGKTGGWKNRKQFPNIKALEKYHKEDNIFLVKDAQINDLDLNKLGHTYICVKPIEVRGLGNLVEKGDIIDWDQMRGTGYATILKGDNKGREFKLDEKALRKHFEPYGDQAKKDPYGEKLKKAGSLGDAFKKGDKVKLKNVPKLGTGTVQFKQDNGLYLVKFPDGSDGEFEEKDLKKDSTSIEDAAKFVNKGSQGVYKGEDVEVLSVENGVVKYAVVKEEKTAKLEEFLKGFVPKEEDSIKDAKDYEPAGAPGVKMSEEEGKKKFGASWEKHKKLMGMSQQKRIDAFIKEAEKRYTKHVIRSQMKPSDNMVKTLSEIYALSPIRVASIINQAAGQPLDSILIGDKFKLGEEVKFTSASGHKEKGTISSKPMIRPEGIGGKKGVFYEITTKTGGTHVIRERYIIKDSIADKVKLSSKGKEQMKQAYLLGKKAFESGKKRVPAHDKELMNMLKGRDVGEQPEGEAPSTDLMKEWTKGWDSANLGKNDSITDEAEFVVKGAQGTYNGEDVQVIKVENGVVTFKILGEEKEAKIKEFLKGFNPKDYEELEEDEDGDENDNLSGPEKTALGKEQQKNSERIIKKKLHMKPVEKLTEQEAKEIVYLANVSGFVGKKKVKDFMQGYFIYEGSEGAGDKFMKKFSKLDFKADKPYTMYDSQLQDKASLSTLKKYDKNIKWGKDKEQPFSQGFAINKVIKQYKIPATEWGHTQEGRYAIIGVGTKKQRMFWKDTGIALEFLGILNKDGSVADSVLSDKINKGDTVITDNFGWKGTVQFITDNGKYNVKFKDGSDGDFTEEELKKDSMVSGDFEINDSNLLKKYNEAEINKQIKLAQAAFKVTPDIDTAVVYYNNKEDYYGYFLSKANKRFQTGNVLKVNIAENNTTTGGLEVVENIGVNAEGHEPAENVVTVLAVINGKKVDKYTSTSKGNRDQSIANVKEGTSSPESKGTSTVDSVRRLKKDHMGFKTVIIGDSFRISFDTFLKAVMLDGEEVCKVPKGSLMKDIEGYFDGIARIPSITKESIKKFMDTNNELREIIDRKVDERDVAFLQQFKNMKLGEASGTEVMVSKSGRNSYVDAPESVINPLKKEKLDKILATWINKGADRIEVKGKRVYAYSPKMDISFYVGDQVSKVPIKKWTAKEGGVSDSNIKDGLNLEDMTEMHDAKNIKELEKMYIKIFKKRSEKELKEDVKNLYKMKDAPEVRFTRSVAAMVLEEKMGEEEYEKWEKEQGISDSVGEGYDGIIGVLDKMLPGEKELKAVGAKITKLLEKKSVKELASIIKEAQASQSEHSGMIFNLGLSALEKKVDKRTYREFENSLGFTDSSNDSVESTYDASKTKPKFKKGDKVRYIPKISGLDPNKVFEVQGSEWKEEDELSKGLGAKWKPTWQYTLKGTSLVALEEDLKKADSSNDSVGLTYDAFLKAREEGINFNYTFDMLTEGQKKLLGELSGDSGLNAYKYFDFLTRKAKSGKWEVLDKAYCVELFETVVDGTEEEIKADMATINKVMLDLTRHGAYDKVADLRAAYDAIKHYDVSDGYFNGNRHTSHVITTLMESGLTRDKAVALLAYHGSLSNINNKSDVKGLLKYKALREMFSDEEARKLIDYLKTRKTKKKKTYDSSQLDDGVISKYKYLQTEIEDLVSVGKRKGKTPEALKVIELAAKGDRKALNNLNKTDYPAVRSIIKYIDSKEDKEGWDGKFRSNNYNEAEMERFMVKHFPKYFNVGTHVDSVQLDDANKDYEKFMRQMMINEIANNNPDKKFELAMKRIKEGAKEWKVKSDRAAKLAKQFESKGDKEKAAGFEKQAEKYAYVSKEFAKEAKSGKYIERILEDIKNKNYKEIDKWDDSIDFDSFDLHLDKVNQLASKTVKKIIGEGKDSVKEKIGLFKKHISNSKKVIQTLENQLKSYPNDEDTKKGLEYYKNAVDTKEYLVSELEKALNTMDSAPLTDAVKESDIKVGSKVRFKTRDGEVEGTVVKGKDEGGNEFPGIRKVGNNTVVLVKTKSGATITPLSSITKVIKK